MATQRPALTVSLAEFAAALLSEREVTPRARLIAHQVAEMLPGAGVAVYAVEDQEAPAWSAKATEGEIEVASSVVAFDAGTLGAIHVKQAAHIFPGGDLPREEYSHLNLRRTLVSLTGVPLLLEGTMFGAIEIIRYDRPMTEADLEALGEVAECAALGMATALAYENERNTQLESITRVTQMYDLEKVFNASLEMEQLLPTIASKFQEVIDAQAVNLWLVEGDGLVLMSCAGVDPSVEEGQRQKSGEGIAAQVSDSGEALAIESAEDERLQQRNAGVEEGAAFSLMAAPVMHGGALVGVVEAINKRDGTPFDEDDVFLLTTINETASNALHNASLLLAERKLEIMETLVNVSREITSTLSLERVLETIVNAPQAIIPYERAAIGLLQRDTFRLSAVTGKTQINVGSPEIRPLNEVLQWAALSEEIVDVRQRDGEIDHPREETRAKFHKYFQETGVRGFFAQPLSDDTGRVGILCLESSDPDFLSQAHLEIIQVLAAQATVALRNAQMYKEVPFISVLEPVLERKRKFMALEKRRRKAYYIGSAALALFLAAFPLPMRVDGDAVVAPAHRAQVQPEVEGVVQKVHVREGEHVSRGQVLAEIGDWDYRSALAAASAKYETAQLLMNRALAGNDGSEAGIQRVQADYWKAEVERAKQLLDKTRLRAPIEGVVATPHVENFVGRRLQFGDSFAEVVDASRAVVDIAIDDDQAGLLRPNSRAAIKLNFYPTHTFRGDVTIVSPKGEVQGDTRVFYARVEIPNPDGAIRTGMEGRGKVTVGWRPAGYVLFRGPLLWIYTKLWSWFGL